MADGDGDRFGACGGSQFPEDGFEVLFDAIAGNAELSGDIVRVEALHAGIEDFDLAVGEPGRKFPCGDHLGDFAVEIPFACEDRSQGRDQFLIRRVLEKRSDGAVFDGECEVGV